MRRTASMKGITVDVMNNGGREPSDLGRTKLLIVDDEIKAANNGLYGRDHQHVSSRYHHRSSSDQGFGTEETAHFLTTCGLCNRRLTPSRDIYMYRGDTAFCSVECREQQMKNDERKEKSSKLLLLQKKTENNHHNYLEFPSENSGKTKSTIAAA